MTLGQRICQYRTGHSLSQPDLAERLDVSRQSVSKWETDASVPELDKLVGMCELFQISMDELVRHTALWCGWAVWLFGMTWVRYATGVHLRFIFHPANYTLHRLSLVMLSLAWGLVLLSCALLFFTGRLFYRRHKNK